MHITFHNPRGGDADNRAKYILDGLVSAKVIRDDSWPTIDSLVLRARRDKPVRTHVVIYNAEAPEP